MNEEQRDTKWQHRLQKFKELVACIADYSSNNFGEYKEFVGNCLQTLAGLKEMTPKGDDDTRTTGCPPPEFLCPITKKIMHNPVVINSGETFEKASIEEWLVNHRACPISKMVIESVELVCTPNVLLLENIMVWSSKNHHGPFRYSDQEVLTQMEENKLVWLLDNVQSSDSSARMRAAEVLRALTKFRKSHRIFLGEYSRFIETMLNALLQKEGTKNSYEEDLYVTMLHVAMHEPNRKALGESNTLVLSLMNGLEPEKIEVIRNTCLSGLSMLASVDSNHEKLGGLGLVKWFLNILKRREDDIMTKNAVRGLLHLCETETNVERFIKEGGVKVFADHISSGKLLLVNNMLSMLVEITKSEKGSVLWRKANGIKLMASVLRKRECALKVKACCIHILENLCLMDPESLRPIREDTELRACISQLGLCKNLSIQTKALHIIHMIYN